MFSRDSYRSFLYGARDMQKTQSNETFKDLIESDRKRRIIGDVFGEISCVPCRRCRNSEVAIEMLIYYLIVLVDVLKNSAESKIIRKQNLEYAAPNCIQGWSSNIFSRILKLKQISKDEERFNLSR